MMENLLLVVIPAASPSYFAPPPLSLVGGSALTDTRNGCERRDPSLSWSPFP